MPNPVEDIPLIRSAYDLSSCGIGVQRHFLDTLVLGRNLQRFEEKAYGSDFGSNLIVNPLVLETVRPGFAGDYKDFFGDRTPSIRQKYASLEQQQKEIYNLILRAILQNNVIYDATPLNLEEYQSLLSLIAKDVGKSTQDVNQNLKKPLTEEDSLIGLFMSLYRVKIFLSEGFAQRMFQYKKEERLRTKHIGFHADKLELMVEILQGCMEVAERSGYIIPQDYRVDTLDSKWAQNWRELLGEEFPTVYDLIDKSKKSIDGARQFLAIHK